jgi:hypothetical protein
MKKNILLIALCFITAVAVAQNRESRNVSGFTKIDYRVPGKLYLRQGATEKVEIEGLRDIVSKIETEVDGSRLIIEMPGTWKWNSDDDKVNVYVTVKNLEGVSVSGSGDLIGEGRFTANDLSLKVSGSGSMKVEIEASGDVGADVSGSGDLEVKGSGQRMESHVSGSGKVIMDMRVKGKSDFSISGSGRIQANGNTDEVEIAISGSGKVLGANFQTNRCDVRISGSGEVEIDVKNELDARISGSGSVSYKGNPSKVNNTSSGSGTVRKM